MSDQNHPRRCDWCGSDPLYMRYHDEEWGVPLYDERALFEFLILEGAQAGLSWITVLRKREHYRKVFDNFDPYKVARYDDDKYQQLLRDPGIIRNKLKIAGAIRNAQAYCDYVEASGSFSELIWSFTDGHVIHNSWPDMASIPVSTDASVQMSRTLKRLGFTFVGDKICYAYMQATGMVNDHLTTCFRHDVIARDVTS